MQNQPKRIRGRTIEFPLDFYERLQKQATDRGSTVKRLSMAILEKWLWEKEEENKKKKI